MNTIKNTKHSIKVFSLDAYTTKHTSKFADLVVKIRERIRLVVLEKKYFSSNLDIFIGLVCEEPPFEGFFKHRRPRLSRKKDAEGIIVNYVFSYEFIIPYASIGQQNLVELTKRYFLENLVLFDKIKDFDVSSLKQDLFKTVNEFEHEPIYLGQE